MGALGELAEKAWDGLSGGAKKVIDFATKEDYPDPIPVGKDPKLDEFAKRGEALKYYFRLKHIYEISLASVQAKIRRVKLDLERIEDSEDDNSDDRIDGTINVENISDELASAKKLRDTYEEGSPMYDEFNKDVVRLEQELEQTSGGIPVKMKSRDAEVRKLERKLKRMERREDYYKEQIKRAGYWYEFTAEKDD